MAHINLISNEAASVSLPVATVPTSALDVLDRESRHRWFLLKTDMIPLLNASCAIGSDDQLMTKLVSCGKVVEVINANGSYVIINMNAFYDLIRRLIDAGVRLYDKESLRRLYGELNEEEFRVMFTACCAKKVIECKNGSLYDCTKLCSRFATVVVPSDFTSCDAERLVKYLSVSLGRQVTVVSFTIGNLELNNITDVEYRENVPKDLPMREPDPIQFPHQNAMSETSSDHETPARKRSAPENGDNCTKRRESVGDVRTDAEQSHAADSTPDNSSHPLDKPKLTDLHAHLTGMGSAKFWVHIMMYGFLGNRYQKSKGKDIDEQLQLLHFKDKPMTLETLLSVLVDDDKKVVSELFDPSAEEFITSDIDMSNENVDIRSKRLTTSFRDKFMFDVVYSISSLASSILAMTEKEAKSIPVAKLMGMVYDKVPALGIVDFLRHCKGYVVFNERSQQFQYIFGIPNHYLIEMAGDLSRHSSSDKERAVYNCLLNCFSMLSVDGKDPSYDEMTAYYRGKFTPEFHPRRYALKDSILDQWCPGLFVFLFHVLSRQSQSHVDYVEYSLSVSHLSDMPFRYLLHAIHLFEPKDPSDDTGAWTLKLEKGKVIQINPIVKLCGGWYNNADGVVVRDSGNVAFMVDMNYDKKFSDVTCRLLASFSRESERLHQKFAGIETTSLLPMDDVKGHYDENTWADIQERLKKLYTFLGVKFEGLMESDDVLEAAKNDVDVTRDQIKRCSHGLRMNNKGSLMHVCMGALNSAMEKAQSWKQLLETQFTSLFLRVNRWRMLVGLDWLGDETEHPFCPFYGQAFVHLSKWMECVSGNVFGFRVHIAENISRPFAGPNALSAKYLSHISIALYCVLLIMQNGVRVRLGHGVHLGQLLTMLVGDNFSECNASVIQHLKMIHKLADAVFTHPYAPVSEVNMTSNYYLLPTTVPSSPSPNESTLMRMIDLQYRNRSVDGLLWNYRVTLSTDNDGIWVIHKCRRHDVHRGVAAEYCMAADAGIITTKEQCDRLIRNGWDCRFGQKILSKDPDLLTRWKELYAGVESVNGQRRKALSLDSKIPPPPPARLVSDSDNLIYVGYDPIVKRPINDDQLMKTVLDEHSTNYPTAKSIIVFGASAKFLHAYYNCDKSTINTYKDTYQKFVFYCSPHDENMRIYPFVKSIFEYFKCVLSFEIKEELLPDDAQHGNAVRSYTVSPTQHYIDFYRFRK